MRRLAYILTSALLLLSAVSCHHREMAYITDAQRDTAQDILQHYTALIMPGDQLEIYVNSKTPESVIDFNQENHRIYHKINRLEYNDASLMAIRDQNRLMASQTTGIQEVVGGYFVDEKGQITFPVLGKLDVGGMTLDGLKNHIEQLLINGGYVVDPMVTTRLMNFRVTVVGEVKIPHQIHVNGTRLTILEAIAMCGDLTDYGMRENLMVMRFDNGKKEYGIIDLTKAEMFNSPYYYLHNNDIVYVEPNKLKKKDSDRDDNTPRYISTLVSAAATIRTWANIFRVRITYQ